MTAIRPVPEPLSRPIRLAVLLSGGGRTLENLAKQIQAGQLSAVIATAICSRSDVAGIARAAKHGVPCSIIRRRDYKTTALFSSAVFEQCRAASVDLVVLAGFLALLHIPPDFENRVLNIHPSLIPAFCGQGFHGLAVHAAVIARGAKVSGCTVHFCDNTYDHGPIVAQSTVPVLDDDDPETLAARVFEAECELYPKAIAAFAAGELEIVGNRVRSRAGKESKLVSRSASLDGRE
jgi:formyltetrahydrofolate-dependent phosphoribosylglycinamide formyltransferase